MVCRVVTGKPYCWALCTRCAETSPQTGSTWRRSTGLHSLVPQGLAHSQPLRWCGLIGGPSSGTQCHPPLTSAQWHATAYMFWWQGAAPFPCKPPSRYWVWHSECSVGHSVYPVGSSAKGGGRFKYPPPSRPATVLLPAFLQFAIGGGTAGAAGAKERFVAFRRG